MKLSFATKLILCNVIFFGALARAEDILFETDVTYKKNNQDAAELKGGSKLKILRGDSILAVSKQNVPILIVAPSSENSQIVVTDSNFASILQDMLRPQLEAESNEIIDSLRRIDVLLQKRDYTQAAQIVNSLKEKYRQISSVLFMSGTVHYLLNDKTTAITDLEKGLAIDNTNESAKSLLKRLKGGA